MSMAANEFRNDKNNFIMYVFLFSTAWFLAVCCLFGVYIYFSFNSMSSVVQDIDGNQNIQEVKR